MVEDAGGGAAPRRSQRERVAESAQRLLDAAVELVAEKGFERTTAVEIGLRAGYSRNMVRDRFGSKDALLDALLERELGERLLPMLGQRDESTGLQQALGQLDDLVLAARAAPSSLRAVLMLSFDVPGHLDSVRAWYSRTIDHVRDALGDQLRLGQRDGSVALDIDVERQVEDYVSHAIGVFFRWMVFPDEVDLVHEIVVWRRRLEVTLARRS